VQLARGLPELTVLSLLHCTGITGAGLKTALGALPSLGRVYLGGCRQLDADSVVEALSVRPGLRFVGLGGLDACTASTLSRIVDEACPAVTALHTYGIKMSRAEEEEFAERHPEVRLSGRSRRYYLGSRWELLVKLKERAAEQQQQQGRQQQQAERPPAEPLRRVRHVALEIE